MCILYANFILKNRNIVFFGVYSQLKGLSMTYFRGDFSLRYIRRIIKEISPCGRNDVRLRGEGGEEKAAASPLLFSLPIKIDTESFLASQTAEPKPTAREESAFVITHYLFFLLMS